MEIIITDQIKKYWNLFIASNEKYKYLEDCKIDAWSFGNTKEMANELGALVVTGKKRATCSLLRAYRGEEDEIPQVGRYSVLVDGDEKPISIIFLKETFIRKFNEVDEEFAAEEGEGDLSYSYWRDTHLSFFGQYPGFTEDDLLICERFDAIII